MNVLDIKLKKPGFYYYQTDMFASIRFGFKFNVECTKENIIKSIILSDYLCKTNAKYETLKEMNNRCRELYGLNYDVYRENIGNKEFLTFSFWMVDHKIIGDNFFKDAIDFFKDVMFSPNFKDGKLKTEVYEEIRKNLINSEEDESTNPSVMQYRYFIKNTIPNSPLVTTRVENVDDLKSVLSKITEKDIIDYYYEVINNFNRGWLVGNVSDEEIDYITNAFSFKTSTFDNNYYLKETLSEGEVELASKDTSQSYLYVVYDIKDADVRNTYKYDAIMSILNSSTTGLILKVLREELGIVYSASASCYNMRGFMCIEAKIDKKNKDKCLEGIDEIFKRLHDKEIIKKHLNFFKEKYEQSMYTSPENFRYYVGSVKSYVYEDEMAEDEEYELVKKLTVDDVLNQVNNLEKRFIFFYRGDKDEN